MQVSIFKPRPELRPFIRSYTFIETAHATDTVVLPHTGVMMAIQFKGTVNQISNHSIFSIPRLVISGIRKSHRQFSYQPNTGTILIQFTETGASAFLKFPLFECYESFFALEDLMKSSEISTFQDRLYYAPCDEDRLALVESFLLSKIAVTKPDQQIGACINHIYSQSGVINIQLLASSVNLSTDAFEKRFRKIVGASPKQFSSIIRMKALIRNHNKTLSFTDLAHSFGFYDQSHFIKQFREFTGQSPREFFKTPYLW